MFQKPTKAKKTPRPTRDEFELEEIANSLTEAHQEKKEVSLIVWRKEEQICGKVAKLDGQTKLIHIEKNLSTLKIPFIDIMKVSII
nr:YolD-like family protein [Bacillus sp. 03113]